MAATAGENGMAWESPGHREDVLAVLDDYFTGRPEVKRGKMFGFPAFSTGGKVFATLFGDGVALKLPPETIDRLADPEIAPFRPMGKSMGGWVLISRPEAESYADDAGLFETSLAYVANQAAAPKPATRKRAKAA
jgi:hypothetical protein